jgi:hypothetical protein
VLALIVLAKLCGVRMGQPQIAECARGADYLVPLKENQPTMLATAKTLPPETLSP